MIISKSFTCSWLGLLKVTVAALSWLNWLVDVTSKGDHDLTRKMATGGTSWSSLLAKTRISSLAPGVGTKFSQSLDSGATLGVKLDIIQSD